MAMGVLGRSAPRNVPSGAVARPRLEAMLDEVVAGGVGLIVAPAGSGKSILIGQWMRRPSTRALQLRVTAIDDDPVHFARSLMAALASVLPQTDVRIADVVAGPGPGELFVSRLLHELERFEDDVVIVLDDIHVLTNAAIFAELDLFIERLPSNVRLVVAARWDPPLRCQQLRLEGRLVEVRAADLAFSGDEARHLVETVSQRSLTDDQITALVVRTEGWAVGLQLAGILLHRSADVDGLIAQFAGSTQLVADYLAEEVIDDLEPDVRRFVLHTSVLEWLSPALCDAVTGDGNAAQMLELLSRRSLFLVPPETAGDPLRYHHLFADLLRYRLGFEPSQEAMARERAARWLLAHGHVADAIEQLVATGDSAGVLAVVMEHGQGFFAREEGATLARWLNLARAQDPDHPAALDVNLLAAQIAAHQIPEAIDTYRRLHRRVDLTTGERAAAAALYSCLGLEDLPTSEVRRAATEAIDLLGAFDTDPVIYVLGLGGRDTVEVLAHSLTAIAMLNDGEIAASARQFEHTLTLPGAQYPIWKLYNFGGLALARALQGRCTEARAAAAAAIDTGNENGVPQHHGLAYAHFALALVALDQVDFDALGHHVQESDIRVRATARAVFVSLQRMVHIEQVALDDGPEAALTALRSSPPAAFDPALFVERRRAQELRLLIAVGKTAAARRLLDEHPETTGALVVDLELASGDLPAARRALHRWGPAADLRATIEFLLRRGAVLAAEGDATGAAAAWQEALEIAELEELRRPFLEQPAAMRFLRAEGERGSQRFARSITQFSSAPRGRAAAQAALVDPLTERELQVLDYLPTRLSNAEMAAALFISVNTLKSHVRHIYAKLAATDRNDAVAKAGGLGLL